MKAAVAYHVQYLAHILCLFRCRFHDSKDHTRNIPWAPDTCAGQVLHASRTTRLKTVLRCVRVIREAIACLSFMVAFRQSTYANAIASQTRCARLPEKPNTTMCEMLCVTYSRNQALFYSTARVIIGRRVFHKTELLVSRWLMEVVPFNRWS